MRVLAWVLVLAVLLSGCGAQTDTWKDVETVTLRSDGYFDRELDAPLILTGDDARKLAKLAAGRWREIPTEKAPEALCGVFAEFDNGVTIGFEPDSYHGVIFETDAGTWYRLPARFCRAVIRILKEA